MSLPRLRDDLNFFFSSPVFLSSDVVNTTRAVRILLLPLHIVTGQTLLGTNATGKTHRNTQ